MDIDPTLPSSAGKASMPQLSSSFNPLTFNYLDIPRSMRSVWSQDPPMKVADGTEPDIHTTTSAREYYRTMITTYVSPAVKALGKNLYPGLRQRRYIPELQTHTPRYDITQPWMGTSPILSYISQLIGLFSPLKESSNLRVSYSTPRATALRLHKRRNR